MIATASTLLQRQGYAATGWRQVVNESETPWGSQSHHFPGGKEQLAVEALERSGVGYERLLRSAFEAADPVSALRLWVDAAAQQLVATDFAEGCPVATVALEMAHTSDAVGDACHRAFAAWQAAISEALLARGLDAARAGTLATTIVAAIEGAMLLTRARRDPTPLHDVGSELVTMLATALGEG